MPFTLAHPAAVLPLVRRPFVGLALVCGAMAPDVPYYLRAMRLPVTAQSWYEPLTNATTTHSPAGLVLVTLPLALMLYLLLLAAAPPLARLVDAPDDGPPRRAVASLNVPAHWWWVLVSLVIGLLTHLLWDSATSSGGFLSAWFPGLESAAFAGLSWIDVLGHASTVAGLALVAVWMWRRRRALTGAAPRRRLLAVVAAVVLLAGLGGGAVVAALTVDPAAATTSRDLVETVLTRAATGGAAAAGAVVVLAVAGWWVRHAVVLWTRSADEGGPR